MLRCSEIPPILKDFPDSFETDRLLVRSSLPGDGPELYAAVRESFDELRPWMPWAEQHKTIADSEESARRARVEFLERTDLRLHIFLKGAETLVGSSGLHRIDWSVPKFEVGYWCRTQFTGRGYTTEAVCGIVSFAFGVLGANRLEIQCDPDNLPSRRVAEKAGFRLEGELRNSEVDSEGKLKNTLVFSLLPGEQETGGASKL